MNRTLYLAVTADRYELPLAVADSVRELAGYPVAKGKNPEHICRTINRNAKKERKPMQVRFIKVTIPDDSN